jgi:MFS family permease
VPRVFHLPDFRRVWAAATISSFGSYVTVLALQVLAAVTLHASAVQLGLINAARWLPYLLFGLLVGVYVDRHRRKPILISTDLGRAGLLCLIPALYASGWLTVWSLVAVVAAFGLLSLFFDAADQSFLPRVVPSSLLTTAFARIEQSDAVAQTTGPLLAAVLVRAVGAPVAILVDAATYLLSGLVLLGVRVVEPVVRPARPSVIGELREGVAWVYRHPMLSPLAYSGHVWFLFHSMLSTVYVLFVLRPPDQGGLGLGPFELGLSYALGGVGAVLGGALASRAGARFGVGRAITTTRIALPFAWLAIAVAAPGDIGLVCTGQFLYWLALGVEGANELGYRNAVTPDGLQGRMNTTIRSANRGGIVVGAVLGGLVADGVGLHPAIWIGVGGLVVAAMVMAASPFRRAVYVADSVQS